MESIRIVEGGVAWLSRDDDHLPPHFCSRCAHKQLMFQPEEDWEVDVDDNVDDDAPCLSCSWPPAERMQRRRLKNKNKASTRTMHLCYMCDFVYLAARVCPRCKAERHVRDGSVHRRDDYCDACQGAADGGRSVQDVVRDARAVTNRPCDVCQIPEYAHAEAIAFFDAKHPFTSGGIIRLS